MNPDLADLVRKHDPDRFLTVLFAPPDRRDALLTLYAFNHELARARSVASEPPLALIRLQWWREVVAGEPKRHAIATPLHAAIAAGDLRADDLLPLIDARDQEAYGAFTTLDDWRGWLLAGAGGLAVAAARALGAPEPERVRPFGAAYGVAALLRATGALAARHRCLLPQDRLLHHGLSPEAFIHNPASEASRAVLAQVALEGIALLRDAEPVPRTAVAAALPAVLARRDMARWPNLHQPRRFGDRFAVVIAHMTGRI
jgi:phytoene synthase